MKSHGKYQMPLVVIVPPPAFGPRFEMLLELMGLDSTVLAWAGERPGARINPAAMVAAIPTLAKGFFMGGAFQKKNDMDHHDMAVSQPMRLHTS